MRVPADAKPGVYRGILKATVNARDSVEFPLELKVVSRVLPSPSEWRIFVDIWQHPWAVARYHGVKPFSDLHYALMERYLKTLAALGQKVITATVVHHPWGVGNNYEGFGSMVEAIRSRDGSWRFNYSVFDEYVAFAKIRILRAEGALPQKVERLLDPTTFESRRRSFFAERTAAVEAAID